MPTDAPRRRQRQAPAQDAAAVATAPSAPSPLTPGDRVLLLQPVEDVPAGAPGRVLQQLGADGLLNVDFGTDMRPRERRVSPGLLQLAP
jgi:hypothetical protein